MKDSFNERELVASATECTGLIPSLTDADPEAEENEARLYAVHAPKQQTREKKCEEGEQRRR